MSNTDIDPNDDHNSDSDETTETISEASKETLIAKSRKRREIDDLLEQRRLEKELRDSFDDLDDEFYDEFDDEL